MLFFLSINTDFHWFILKTLSINVLFFSIDLKCYFITVRGLMLNLFFFSIKLLCLTINVEVLIVKLQWLSRAFRQYCLNINRLWIDEERCSLSVKKGNLNADRIPRNQHVFEKILIASVVHPFRKPDPIMRAGSIIMLCSNEKIPFTVMPINRNGNRNIQRSG
jgi:hypothetical protein